MEKTRLREKNITVIFASLNGSPSLAGADLVNNFFSPLISKHQGTAIKTTSRAILASFPEAREGLQAALEMQKEIDALNLQEKFSLPLLLRIGLHSGAGNRGQSDLFSELIDTAGAVQRQANYGEIYLTEETFNILGDSSELYCRFAGAEPLKGEGGKKRVRVYYKVFWNPSERELDQFGKKPAKKILPGSFRLALFILLPFLLTLALIPSHPEEKRSNEQRIYRNAQ